MSRKTLPILTAVFLLTASALNAGQAVLVAAKQGGFVAEDGGSERIVLAGKLRMLSQKIPSAACHNFAGIDQDMSREDLRSATAEFNLILDGLTDGAPSLGIPTAEADSRILRRLNAVHEVWDPVNNNIRNTIELGGYTWTVGFVSSRSVPLLDMANLLVSDLVGEYSDPTSLLQADALKIDISERQRMLAQRMAKNACLVANDLWSETAQLELAETVKLFDASAGALRFGMPAASIEPGTDPVINAHLDTVLDVWSKVRPLIDRVAGGGAISEDEKTQVYHNMNELTEQMTKVTNLYSAASKLDL